jgi:hypothetical protein
MIKSYLSQSSQLLTMNQTVMMILLTFSLMMREKKLKIPMVRTKTTLLVLMLMPIHPPKTMISSELEQNLRSQAVTIVLPPKTTTTSLELKSTLSSQVVTIPLPPPQAETTPLTFLDLTSFLTSTSRTTMLPPRLPLSRTLPPRTMDLTMTRPEAKTSQERTPPREKTWTTTSS